MIFNSQVQVRNILDCPSWNTYSNFHAIFQYAGRLMHGDYYLIVDFVFRFRFTPDFCTAFKRMDKSFIYAKARINIKIMITMMIIIMIKIMKR